MTAALVAIVSVLAITAAGMLHHSAKGGRRATSALLIVVAVLGVATTATAATAKVLGCDCNDEPTTRTEQ